MSTVREAGKAGPALTLISGAASGMGRAIARQLSSSRRLLLLDKNGPGLEETKSGCAQPESHVLWQFDLSALDTLEQELAKVLGRAGCVVEAFVHCAGIVTILPAKSADHRAAKEIMTVNFLAAADITSALLKKRVNGPALRNVIFISSIWSKFGARGHSLYCASKGALDSYMKALAAELAPAVRVNSILPGAIKTPLATAAMADEQIAAKFKRDYLLGLGEPGDIANMVEFLLSERARWITGQQIVVDGGRTVDMSLK